MKKAESNKQNAKLSTGPKTPEGLARSSKNALKHGITSKDVVLNSESKKEYESLLQSMIECLCPADQVENMLVERAAQYAWRLRRVSRTETDMYDRGREDVANEAIFMSSGGMSREEMGIGDIFALLERRNSSVGSLVKYEAHCERGFYRALHDLERRQAARSGRPSIPPVAIDVVVTGDSRV